MWMIPKSGSPVFGHIEVNSGQSIAISNSRPGRGLGNVSIIALDIPSKSLALWGSFPRNLAQSPLTLRKARARIRRISGHFSRPTACARGTRVAPIGHAREHDVVKGE